MSATRQPGISPAEGLHDFNFLYGHWQVHNKRLLKRLRGCTEWESFAATQACQPLLGGMGNTDEMWTQAGPVGMSLRFFDVRAGQWQIYWVNPRDGVLQPPVRGAFVNDVGVFEGLDEHEGQPIRVRYQWQGTRSSAPCWEQAFSADDGKTWETNWVMSFTRMEAAMPPHKPLSSVNHDFDFFFGVWKVRNRRLLKSPHNENAWETFDGVQLCRPLLGGLANYDELRDARGTPMGLSIHLFEMATQRWKARWVSALDGLVQPPVMGGFTADRGLFEGLDEVQGRPARLRYTWSDLNTPAPRWEQAHSSDEGRTWETNWLMNYTRMEE